MTSLTKNLTDLNERSLNSIVSDLKAQNNTIQRATTKELGSDRETIYKDNLSIHDNELYYRNDNSDNHSNNFNTDKVEQDKQDKYTRYYQSSREQNKQINSIIERETRHNKSSRSRLSRITKQLREIRTRTNQEYEQNTIFNKIYTDIRTSLKSNVTNRIREFIQQFCENITRFGEILYEQGKRCIKSSINEIRKFVIQNKKELERIMLRDSGMSR